MFLHLHNIRPNDDARIGRCAQALARLCRSGMNVLPGLVVTPEAMEKESWQTSRDFLQSIRDLCRMHKTPAGQAILLNVALSPLSGPSDGVHAESFVKEFCNIGFTPDVVEDLLLQYPKVFVLRAYVRFLCAYATRVYGLSGADFVDVDLEKNASQLQKTIKVLEKAIASQAAPVPTDAYKQLEQVTQSMITCWKSSRYQVLRMAHGLDADLCASLLIQPEISMQPCVDGWTGWVDTHNSMTGSSHLAGCYQSNGAHGAAEVPITPAMVQAHQLNFVSYQAQGVLRDALRIRLAFDGQQINVLQVSSLERTGKAAVEITVDLAERGIITLEQALLDIKPQALEAYLHSTLIHTDMTGPVIARGLPASPGAVVGEIVLSTRTAEAAASRGANCILIIEETTSEDIKGIHCAVGVVTIRGGLTSHAAVVARGIGRPCVVGANSVHINKSLRILKADNGQTLQEGDIVTLDGTSGAIFQGQAEVVPAQVTGAFAKIMEWSDAFRQLEVLANADTLQDARIAQQFQADGVGLCRTEHMFFSKDRLDLVREMIFAASEEDRFAVLSKLKPLQVRDLRNLFKTMHKKSVTIRLLDIPLHEFLPRGVEAKRHLAEHMCIDMQELELRINELDEANPMLGKRGCRLGLLYPEIYDMQVQAIFEAATQLDNAVRPEIMVPLVSSAREVALIAQRVKNIAAQHQALGQYKFGIMIETPRAALCAGVIAPHVDFISFGTNDLTQMVFGLSRDDAGRFMRDYLNLGIWDDDPFQKLDRSGVGVLIQSAISQTKMHAKDVRVGLCGEHGGDPFSIHFCAQESINYVSCSPYRVPIAKLAAAQAAIQLI